MYLNDLNSAQHSVKKLNKILADTFDHEVDLSSMNFESLNRMLSATNAKIQSIKESDLKYWENPQYNKLGLIQHQLKTYITEIAPTRSDSKRVKTKESTVMEADLDQAEVLLAAQELVDELQKMVEDVAEMQVQKLMPIVDAMKQQVGFEVAEVYNNAADGALGALLDAMKTTKDALENATLTARGEQPAAPAPTDMGMSDADMDPEAPMDDDMEAPDEFGGDEAAAGEENPVGRELKGESAIANMEKGALAEKKFIESKDRLFKMVESGQMSQEHFINIISELDLQEKDPYGQKQMDTRTLNTGGMAGSIDIGTPQNLDNKRGFTPAKPKVGKPAPRANPYNADLRKGDQGFDAMQTIMKGMGMKDQDMSKVGTNARPNVSQQDFDKSIADLRKNIKPGDPRYNALQNIPKTAGKPMDLSPNPMISKTGGGPVGPKPMRFGGMARLNK
tara:strand:- start:2886 stop:4232 length:1347 start_codon:yes stop_codon:yes gene_type:complete